MSCERQKKKEREVPNLADKELHESGEISIPPSKSEPKTSTYVKKDVVLVSGETSIQTKSVEKEEEEVGNSVDTESHEREEISIRPPNQN